MNIFLPFCPSVAKSVALIPRSFETTALHATLGLSLTPLPSIVLHVLISASVGLSRRLIYAETSIKSHLMICLMHWQVWDFSSHLNALAEAESDRSQGASAVSNHSPLFKFGGHKDEGYAIDWSPHVPGRLVSGMGCHSLHM